MKTSDSTNKSPPATSVPKAKKPTSRAEFIAMCASVPLAMAAQMGCSGAQLRPAPGNCPDEALKAMFYDLGCREETCSLELLLDRNQDDEDRAGVYRDGPVVGIVTDTEESGLPEGTLLYGTIWTGDARHEAMIVRYTEAKLPNGRRLPVCIQACDDDADGCGWGEGSVPGAVRAAVEQNGYTVEQWP